MRLSLVLLRVVLGRLGRAIWRFWRNFERMKLYMILYVLSLSLSLVPTTSITSSSPLERGANILQRLKPLQNLFPSIPPSLIIKALHHPKYSAGPSDQTSSEAIAPLVDAILSGGGDLPEDLGELKEVVRGLGQDPLPSVGGYGSSDTYATGGGSGSGSGSGTRSTKVERRNIWDEELDLSRLKLANDESYVSLSLLPLHSFTSPSPQLNDI